MQKVNLDDSSRGKIDWHSPVSWSNLIISSLLLLILEVRLYVVHLLHTDIWGQDKGIHSRVKRNGQELPSQKSEPIIHQIGPFRDNEDERGKTEWLKLKRSSIQHQRCELKLRTKLEVCLFVRVAALSILINVYPRRWAWNCPYVEEHIYDLRGMTLFIWHEICIGVKHPNPTLSLSQSDTTYLAPKVRNMLIVASFRPDSSLGGITSTNSEAHTQKARNQIAIIITLFT